jgi:putative flavoprotein involved in K+ transport
VWARERYRRSGRTAERGLFVLGMHWMHTIASGLLFGVGADAAHRADALQRDLAR